MNAEQLRGLWNLLGQTWGSRFLEQYGTQPNEAWSAALAHVSPEAARHALKGLIGEGSAFPPTLPEFISWAKKYRPSVVKYDANGRGYLGDEPEVVRLPQRSVDPEKARQNLEKLRQMLRK